MPPKTDEKIDDIVILSTKDFDVNHPSSSDLDDLFDVVLFAEYSYKSIKEKFNLNDCVKTNPSIPRRLVLILREKPDSTTNFEFSVRYYKNGVEDNDYFEFTTNNIVIKRNE